MDDVLVLGGPPRKSSAELGRFPDPDETSPERGSKFGRPMGVAVAVPEGIRRAHRTLASITTIAYASTAEEIETGEALDAVPSVDEIVEEVDL